MATQEEIDQAEADQKFWHSIMPDEGWRLIGFTYRHSAVFAPDKGNSIEITRAHLKFFGVCDKNCEYVFHMTGGEHRVDCAAYGRHKTAPVCACGRGEAFRYYGELMCHFCADEREGR